MTEVFKIADRLIGRNYPPFIIAEMSGNHNQSLERALEIVEAAAKTGAHALKIQTYTPDTMTIDLDEREFHISDPTSIWAGTTLYKLYGEAYTRGNGTSRFLIGRANWASSPSAPRLTTRRWIFSKIWMCRATKSLHSRILTCR